MASRVVRTTPTLLSSLRGSAQRAQRAQRAQQAQQAAGRRAWEAVRTTCTSCNAPTRSHGPADAGQPQRRAAGGAFRREEWAAETREGSEDEDAPGHRPPHRAARSRPPDAEGPQRIRALLLATEPSGRPPVHAPTPTHAELSPVLLFPTPTEQRAASDAVTRSAPPQRHRDTQSAGWEIDSSPSPAQFLDSPTGVSLVGSGAGAAICGSCGSCLSAGGASRVESERRQRTCRVPHLAAFAAKSGAASLLTKLLSPAAEARHGRAKGGACNPLHDRALKAIEQKRNVTNMQIVHVPHSPNKVIRATTEQLTLKPNLKTISAQHRAPQSAHVRSTTHTSRQSFMASINITVKNCSTVVSEQTNKCPTESAPKALVRSAPISRQRNRQGKKTALQTSAGTCSLTADQKKINESNPKQQSKADQEKEHKPTKVAARSGSANENKLRDIKSKCVMDTVSKESVPRKSKFVLYTLPDLVKVKVSCSHTPSSQCLSPKKKTLDAAKSEMFHTDAKQMRSKVEDGSKKAESDQNIFKCKSEPLIRERKGGDNIKNEVAKSKEKDKHSAKKLRSSYEAKKSKIQDKFNKTLGRSPSKTDITDKKLEIAEAEREPSLFDMIKKRIKKRRRKRKGAKSGNTTLKSTEEKDMTGAEVNSDAYAKFKLSSDRRRRRRPQPGTGEGRAKMSASANDAAGGCAGGGAGGGAGGSADGSAGGGDESPKSPGAKSGQQECAQSKTASAGEKPRRKKCKAAEKQGAPPEQHAGGASKAHPPSAAAYADMSDELKMLDDTVEKITKSIVFMDKCNLPPPPCVHKYKHMEGRARKAGRAGKVARDANAQGDCKSPYIMGKPVWGTPPNKSKPAFYWQKVKPPKATDAVAAGSHRQRSPVAVRIKRSSVVMKGGDEERLKRTSTPKKRLAQGGGITIPIQQAREAPETPTSTPAVVSVSTRRKDTPCEERKGIIEIRCRPSPESLLGFGKNFGKVWPPPYPPVAPGTDPCGPKRTDRARTPPPSPFDHVCTHPLFPGKPLRTERPRDDSLTARAEREEQNRDAMALCRMPAAEPPQSDCFLHSKREKSTICVPPKGVKVFSPWRRLLGALFLLLAPILWWFDRRRRRRLAQKQQPRPCIEDDGPLPVCEPPPPPPAIAPAPCAECSECPECPGAKVSAEKADAEGGGGGGKDVPPPSAPPPGAPPPTAGSGGGVTHSGRGSPPAPPPVATGTPPPSPAPTLLPGSVGPDLRREHHANAPRHEIAPRYETTPPHDNSPRSDMAPVHDKSPRYDMAPVHDKSPRYDMAPVHDKSPRYDMAPLYEMSPQDDNSPHHEIVPPNEMPPQDYFSPPHELAPPYDMAPQDDHFPRQEIAPPYDMTPQDDHFPRQELAPPYDMAPQDDHFPRQELAPPYDMAPQDDHFPRQELAPPYDMAPQDGYSPRHEMSPHRDYFLRQSLQPAYVGEASDEAMEIGRTPSAGALSSFIAGAASAGAWHRHNARKASAATDCSGDEALEGATHGVNEDDSYMSSLVYSDDEDSGEQSDHPPPDAPLVDGVDQPLEPIGGHLTERSTQKQPISFIIPEIPLWEDI